MLEQIAKATIATLDRLERRLDSSESSIRADLRELRTDFRWLLGIMLGGFAGLLGVMAHGFHWLLARPPMPDSPIEPTPSGGYP